MENLLYYPYINLPETDWTARALLYYERVGSIVPQRFLFDEFDPHMKKIVEAGLVVPINPLTVLENPWEISRPFIEYLSSKEFNLKRRRKLFRSGKSGQIHQDKLGIQGPRIHADKFDGEIFYQLMSMGLALRKDQEWFQVEQQTADDLMTYLASVIGGKLNYLPTTNKDEVKFSLSFMNQKSQKEFQSHQTLDKKRKLILKELIPFPENIDFVKLRKFKEDYSDQLRAFKNKIELIVLNNSIDENSSLFKETITELKIRKEEIAAKMNEKQLGKIFFGTVCGTIGAAISLTTADTWTGAALALPSFANAIYSAFQIERVENNIDPSGMKYLALIDKKLSIKRI